MPTLLIQETSISTSSPTEKNICFFSCFQRRRSFSFSFTKFYIVCGLDIKRRWRLSDTGTSIPYVPLLDNRISFSPKLSLTISLFQDSNASWAILVAVCLLYVNRVTKLEWQPDFIGRALVFLSLDKFKF